MQEVKAGRIRIVAAVQSRADGTIQLSDGTSITPDSVIAATGYRPGLEPIVGHLGVLDDRGTPRVHGARTLPSAPGLYFAGIEVLLAGLLREIGIEAKAIGESIAGQRVASAGQR